MNSDYTPKINLLDYKNSEERERKNRLRETLLYTLVLLLVAAAAAGVGYYQYNRLAVLTAQNQELTLERQQLAAQAIPEGRVYVGGMERQKTLDQLLEKRISYIEPLKNVYWQAEPGIYLNRVEAEQDKLTINGYVQGQEGMIEFGQRMLQAPGVKGVKSVDSRLNEKCGEVTFNLVLDWEVKP
jgi:Tfp pilus assembly protein PilN